MKWCILILFILISCSTLAYNETIEISELKNLVREGDKALMDEIQNQNAKCTQEVNSRYNEFVGGIESRTKDVFYIERIVLIISLFCSLFLFWSIKGILGLYIKRQRSKAQLTKLESMHRLIEECKQLLDKKDIEKSLKKYRKIERLYIKLDDDGKKYIYNEVLALHKLGVQNGRK